MLGYLTDGVGVLEVVEVVELEVGDIAVCDVCAEVEVAVLDEKVLPVRY